MTELIKPVRYGILIGLFGLVFGIGWAFWLVLGHERIHQSLEESVIKGMEQSSIQILEPNSAHAHTDADESPKQEVMAHTMEHATEDIQKPYIKAGHDNPIFELSHTRLRRGHLHAMGLGLVTIAVSFILAFTSAPDRIKTIASILAGLGGIIYPFAWIVMGYKTPALGPEGAEMFATKIAGPGVLLVLLGISTAVIFLLKDIFSKR